MKKLALVQQARLNTGVIGVLGGEGYRCHTLEGQKCLEEGTYLLEYVEGFYRFEDGYTISQNTNGQYRDPQIILGKLFNFKSFDLTHKGDAIQDLYHFGLGEPIEVEVFRSEAFDPVFETAKDDADEKAEEELAARIKAEAEASEKAKADEKAKAKAGAKG